MRLFEDFVNKWNFGVGSCIRAAYCILILFPDRVAVFISMIDDALKNQPCSDPFIGSLRDTQHDTQSEITRKNSLVNFPRSHAVIAG